MKAIINGKIVLPDRVVEGKVLCFDEKIAGFSDKNGLPEDVGIIDAGNGYVVPGFVDIHVHGGGGSDFLDGGAEDVFTALRLHASHGTTSITPTTLTCEDFILERGLATLAEAIENGTPDDCGEILGIHMEGPYFSAASKGAQAITTLRTAKRSELDRWYELAKGHIIRFDAAPELPDTDIVAEWAKEHGILASIGHSGANAETAIEYLYKGFTHITHLYSATSTEHKEGQVVHGGIIEAAYLMDGFTVELIGDGKHIPRETMQLCFKIKGADRTALVTDAMRAAGTDVKTSVLGERTTGTPVIVEEGVAKLPDRSFYAGSIGTMDVCFRTALRYGIPLIDASKSCSLTPARIIGVSDRKGSLEEGKDADILIFDNSFELKNVFLRGKMIKGRLKA